MAEEKVAKQLPANPCCELWKEKLDKLQQKLTRSDNYRRQLKEGVANYEKYIEKISAEKVELEKVREEERIRADNEREEKLKESAIRVSLENEISAMKSEVSSLKEKVSSGAEDVGEEVVLLRTRLAEREKEINKLKDQLEEEKKRSDSETKKAKTEMKRAETELKKAETKLKKAENKLNKSEEELKKANEALKTAKLEKARVEKLQKDNEKEMNVKELAIRTPLENEISVLKSQITLLQQQAQDVEKEVPLLQARVCERETEINQLKELLQKEKDKADAGKKKFDEEMKKADAKVCRAEEQAENEREEKAKVQATQFALEDEISALKSQILLVQQKAGDAAQDVENNASVLKASVSEKDREINQLKELLENEKARADFEKRKADEEKQKADEEKKKADEMLDKMKAEKTRADEEREVAAIERKKAEDAKHELERISVEANELRSKLHVETSKLQQANKTLETERQNVIKEKRRVDLEMAKAEELRKLSEISGRKFEEEKSRADCLSKELEEGKRALEKIEGVAKYLSSGKPVEAPSILSINRMNLENATPKGKSQLEMTNIEAAASKLVLGCLKCEEVNKKLKDVTLKADREKERADSEIRKIEEQKKVLEAYEQKALEEKNRADQLALELEDNRRKTEELKKEMEVLVPSRTLIDPLASTYMNTEAKRRKLLRKELKLEKMQVMHAKQVADLEKDRNLLLQREILHLKEEFSQVSNHLDTLDKYFSYRDGGIDDLEKNRNVSQRQKLYLKRKFLAEEPDEMHLQSGNEYLKRRCTALKESDPITQRSIECNATLLPISERTFTESISGIDSKLDPLLRGSKQTMLKSSSAINSSMASFSDRPLMGSQERGALSVIELDKLVEGKANSQPTISRKSYDITKSNYDKNIAVVAENSVRSPLRNDALGLKAGQNKKRKGAGKANVSIEHVYTEGKKWHMQTLERISVVQDIIENHNAKCFGEQKCLLNHLHDNDCIKRNALSEEGVAKQLEILNALNSKIGNGGGGVTYVDHSNSRQANNSARTVHACNEEPGGTSGNNSVIPEGVEDEDYFKLLELDSPFEEEKYLAAIERPLSPTLPEIGFQLDGSKSLVVGCTNAVVSVQNEKGSFSDFCEIIESDDNCMSSQTMQAGNSSVDQLGNRRELALLNIGNEGINNLLTNDSGSCRDDIPRFCVISSVINDSSSISKVFRATTDCVTRCSTISQPDQFFQTTVSALMKFEDLLPKEKVCVFLSLLLQNSPVFASENFKDHIPFLDSFAGVMRSVMDNQDTRRVFEELLNLDDLLNLIEDFLIERRVLVYVNVDPDALPVVDARATVILSDRIVLSFQVASAQHLIAAAVVLASICTAVDHIGFLCEASYNIFKMQKIDSSMLDILHVFAIISGAEYLRTREYSLLMTVIKSLVTFLERENLPTGSTWCCQALFKGQPGVPPFNECPFADGVVSMEEVVSLLIGKLHNYASSDFTNEGLVESIVLLDSKAVDGKEKSKSWSGDGQILCAQCRKCDASFCLHKTQKSCSVESDSDGTLFHLGDVLSLVELVASNMSWNWQFNNIVLQLLKMLDTCAVEKSLPAVVILLGQLGKLGVDANGYDDAGVESLRGRLSAFLCRSVSSNMSLPIQVATVSALLGLISPSFEELISSSTVLPEAVSNSNPCSAIKKWFSSLSKDQQSLSSRLLIL